MKVPALLVDDNDDYARMLLTHLEPLGYEFQRAKSAAEGCQNLFKSGVAYYGLVVTDITMEGQTAGLRLIRKMRRKGYLGTLIVASTGFNAPVVAFLAKPFMALWGVDVLIPKEPLKRGQIVYIPISKKGREFVEEKS
ncbi:MAG: response regulator [bacterium]